MKNEVDAWALPAQSAGDHRRSRVFLSAFGVHVGGGLVLLQALLKGLGTSLHDALMDERVRGTLPLPKESRVQYQRPSMVGRFLRLGALASRMGPGDVLFCFNSLPPLRKPAGRVITYVQAPYIVGIDAQVRYRPLQVVRHAIERLWFRAGVRNCDEVWVQTGTMARNLRAAYPGVPVHVVPFVDDELARTLRAAPVPYVPARVDYAAHSFFYPADGVAHKNHATLLQAWAALGAQGLLPRLCLTLRPEEFDVALRAAGVTRAQLPSVENLGRLSRAQVLERLRSSSALIFPSRMETFGLPMLEARGLGVPIVASERDFVRDVCAPAQTFDPASPASIASAVQRFVEGGGAAADTCFTAADIAQRLLNPTP